MKRCITITKDDAAWDRVNDAIQEVIKVVETHDPFVKEQTVYLNFNHESFASSPLPCPTKGHAAWLARMLVLAEASVCDIHCVPEITPVNYAIMAHLEQHLLLQPFDRKCSSSCDGSYRAFWISATGD